MRVADFDFDLPADLIAQFPPAVRGGSRLLHVEASGTLHDRWFSELPALLRPDDLLVMNDTRVIKARLFGQKDSGGKVELLVERVAGEFAALAFIRASHAPEPGAVAAPTAGLHFDDAMLDTLQQQGIRTARVTLHVGAGTFQPVRVDDVAEHKMHSERYTIPPATVDAIRDTHARGGRVVAVGTTSLRALEAAAQSGKLHAGSGETDIFITPGYRFKMVDTLITNFHLPKSTLLMLVSAFAGVDTIRAAYAHAIAERYRFFSYGDAMIIEKTAPSLNLTSSPPSAARAAASSNSRTAPCR